MRKVFQSTLPREERQAGDTYTDIMYIDFNPRSHERSDVTRCVLLQLYYISIHAPTRGATDNGNYGVVTVTISIHAPTREATRLTIMLSVILSFQSTLPREERRCWYRYWCCS